MGGGGGSIKGERSLLFTNLKTKKIAAWKKREYQREKKKRISSWWKRPSCVLIAHGPSSNLKFEGFLAGAKVLVREYS